MAFSDTIYPTGVRPMFYLGLGKVLDEMTKLGLIKSQRQFSREWLGQGATYLNDYKVKCREEALISGEATQTLVQRLSATAALCGRLTSARIEAVLREIEQARRVAKFVSRDFR